MTTAIFFDLDGTLLSFDCPYDRLLREAFERELGHTSAAMVDAYEERFAAAFEAIEADPVEAGMAAALAAERLDGDPEALASALLDAELRHSILPEGTVESLDALAESNRLGVLTNGVTDWQRAKLDHHGLLARFETVVCSYEIGAHKPDAAPFAAARERIDAETYVMVGDDYEADIEGARAAGFVPVRVEESDGTPGFWATLRAMV